MNMYHTSEGFLHYSFTTVGDKQVRDGRISFDSLGMLFNKMATFFDENTPTSFKIKNLTINNFLSHKPKPSEDNNFFSEKKVCDEKHNAEIISSLHFLLIQLLFESGKSNYLEIKEKGKQKVAA